MTRRIPPTLAAICMLAGCASPQFGDSVYSAQEVGVAKPVERCQVLGVREVEIRDPDGNYWGQTIGAAAGGIAGGVLGNEVGAGSGRFAASALGALVGSVIGAAAGNRVGEDVNRRRGLEYAVQKQDGQEITFAQEILPGDRVLRAGEPCRMQIDPNGNNRVMPARYQQQQVPPAPPHRFY